ncbi:hypothetical protein KVR01_004368 [Diaporthe batatas]|uniref:uncharacterized protein n=1 Tax=Diaporthe batatas TaxID=748121 RepID=UPI001D036D80|nr:uncharacterized protein KVR01_004368 [Diaporthe batatas]KAG8165816.1 hypothetical protein KVR01_004368 [Diaporthe batatas]
MHTKADIFGPVPGFVLRKPLAATGTFLVFSIFGFLVWCLLSNLVSPLRKHPGPWLARYTNLWRFFLALRSDYRIQIKKLHEKHGPVLRIGPSLLDLDIPELGKVIYSTGGNWRKTEFYQNNSAVVNGKIVYHLFSTTDQEEHARMKRPIVKYYSQGSVLALEPLMDTVISDFCDHLESRFMDSKQGKECDLGQWIAFYSWDMNGAATFSQRFGYMDTGRDHDKTIEIADKAMDYFPAVGQMPFLDFLLDKNPVMRIGPPNLGTVTRIAAEHLVARLSGKDASFNPKVPDFLQYFLNAKSTHPDLVDDGVIMGYLLVNLLAGADTTAITIRTIFYYTLRDPAVYKKLEAEIVAADLAKVAPYNAARALPYLEAVVRESMRMHPAVSMILERHVPSSGLTLPDGSFIPPKTAVGINPFVAGRNKSVWGEDADEFRPERWLRRPGDSDDEYNERLRMFNACDLTFGGGSRVCIGRSLAYLEIYKIVATLVGRYQIQLVDPTREWEISGSWFPRQSGIMCYLKKRA